MVVEPVAAPVIANRVLVAPATIFTVDGTVAMPVGLVERVIISPPVGAGDPRVMVPFSVCETPSVPDGIVMVIDG